MPLEEKRSYYRCGGYYVTLEDLQTWHDYAKDSHYYFTRKGINVTLRHLAFSFHITPITIFPLLKTHFDTQDGFGEIQNLLLTIMT
jgi:hypothetical protein